MAVAIEALPTKVIAGDDRVLDGARENRGWHALHPGAEVAGRYALDRMLGAGGSGSVYRAQDLKLHRAVALKILHPHLGGDPEVVERFRREARLAARLNDGHITSVYDLGHWACNHFMALEYASGRPLSVVIRDQAPMDPSRAIDLMAQMLRAARCIHAHGIVHRDLKPANAIVDRGGRLKVVDFGIAQADGADLTQTGSLLGTARYASPEQAAGRAVTPASDLYSVGVILCELLAGRPPFEAVGVVALGLMHINEPPPPLAAARPGIAPRIATTVMRSLHKDPAMRFADADHFMAALERARA